MASETDATDQIDGTTSPSPDGTATASDNEATPGGLGRLAGTIRRRTLDLVAIAILVGAGLTFGARLTDWWNRDADDLLFQPTEQPTWSWNDPNQPVEIVFGDADFALEREVHHGPTETAVERLLDRTLELAETSESADRPSDGRHAELVESALAVEPSRTTGDGRCSVHLSMLPLPTAVGLRSSRDDEGRPGVVCWGVLLGGGDDVWTVYWFVPRNGSEGQVGSTSLVPPPEARTTLRILDARGAGLWGLRGPGTAEEWRRHFESRLAKSATSWSGWTSAGGVWTGRFESESEGWTVDVRFEEQAGVCDGIAEIHHDTP